MSRESTVKILAKHRDTHSGSRRAKIRSRAAEPVGVGEDRQAGSPTALVTLRQRLRVEIHAQVPLRGTAALYLGYHRHVTRRAQDRIHESSRLAVDRARLIEETLDCSRILGRRSAMGGEDSVEVGGCQIESPSDSTGLAVLISGAPATSGPNAPNIAAIASDPLCAPIASASV